MTPLRPEEEYSEYTDRYVGWNLLLNELKGCLNAAGAVNVAARSEYEDNWRGVAKAVSDLRQAIATLSAQISNNGGGGGGGDSYWGGITGTLSNQLDLQFALNAKANSIHSQAFNTITGTPTTLEGYGITNAQLLAANLTSLAGLATSGNLVKSGNIISTNPLSYTQVGGRLSASPEIFPSADIASDTIFFNADNSSPFCGQISLYDGTIWKIYTFTQITKLLTIAANTNCDIFVFLDSNQLALDVIAWNGNDRVTQLATIDNVLVSANDNSRRYVGTIRTNETGLVKTFFGKTPAAGGSKPEWFIWNLYNQKQFTAYVLDSTATWTYTLAAFRAKNNSTSNRFSFVQGIQGNCVQAISKAYCFNSNAARVVVRNGIGFDSSTAFSGLTGNAETNSAILTELSSVYGDAPPIGFHFLQELEFSGATGTTTWYGRGGTNTQTGMMVSFLA